MRTPLAVMFLLVCTVAPAARAKLTFNAGLSAATPSTVGPQLDPHVAVLVPVGLNGGVTLRTTLPEDLLGIAHPLIGLRLDAEWAYLNVGVISGHFGAGLASFSGHMDVSALLEFTTASEIAPVFALGPQTGSQSVSEGDIAPTAWTLGGVALVGVQFRQGTHGVVELSLRGVYVVDGTSLAHNPYALLPPNGEVALWLRGGFTL
jgi:hypothetical protein